MRPRDPAARALRVAVAGLLVVGLGGAAHASASRLTVAGADRVASGVATVSAPCDEDVTTSLVYENDGTVDTERIDALDVLDVDPAACLHRTVAVTGYDTAGTLLLSAAAPLPEGAASVRLGFAPVTATSVHSLVVTLS